MTILLVFFFIAVAAISALGGTYVRRYALARSLVDVPNARSSHVLPTPRGGGLVIALGWLGSIAALTIAGVLSARLAAALGGGGTAVALVGWLDDHGRLNVRTRLLVHLGASTWVVVWLGGFPELDVGVANLHLGPVGAVLAVLALAWLINLYNFMDGIDGLAASEAVMTGGTMSVILLVAGTTGLGMASLVTAGAAAGFLRWNWEPAKMFMGDVGSGLLGFAFGATALAADRTAGVPALLLALPLSVFIGDATYTLGRRLVRGETLHHAHCTHVYQRLVRQGWSHARVTLSVAVLNVCLALGTGIAWLRPRLLPWILALTVVGLAATAIVALRARLREQYS